MRHHITLATVALTSCMTVSAQTAQVFGAIDLNIKSVHNSRLGNLKSMGGDDVYSNRLGFRGREDLGGGMRAEFWLEGVLAPDTGAGGGFTRKSTIGLIGSFGEIRLGRDYVPTFFGFSHFDALGISGMGNVANVLSTLGTSATTLARANNSVAYFTPPTLGGFYGHVTVAAGEGGPSGNKYAGFRLGWQQGSWNAAISHGQTEVNASGDDFKVSTIGASKNLGRVTAMAYWLQTKFLGLRQDNLQIGLQAKALGGEIRVSYIKSDASGPGVDTDDATKWSGEYQYDLSKRTALYGAITRIANEGKAAFVVPGTANGNAAGTTTTGAAVGIRHLF